VLEGKYWKRKLAAVTAEYKKWRMFYRNHALGQSVKDDVEMVQYLPTHDLLYNNRPVHFIKNALCKCFRERTNFRQNGRFTKNIRNITKNDYTKIRNNKEKSQNNEFFDFIFKMSFEQETFFSVTKT
jgi:hypothetical protein